MSQSLLSFRFVSLFLLHLIIESVTFLKRVPCLTRISVRKVFFSAYTRQNTKLTRTNMHAWNILLHMWFHLYYYHYQYYSSQWVKWLSHLYHTGFCVKPRATKVWVASLVLVFQFHLWMRSTLSFFLCSFPSLSLCVWMHVCVCVNTTTPCHYLSFVIINGSMYVSVCRSQFMCASNECECDD